MKLWTRPSPTHFLSRVDTLTRDIAAQPRQVGGSDRRNVISAETSATSRPVSVCDCGWGQPVSIGADENAWRHLGPATDIREARHSGSKVV